MMKFLKVPRIAALKLPQQWALLVLLTVLVTSLLSAIHLPGALLIGPMAAGICIALNGARLSVHLRLYQGAQATVGCLIGATLTPSIFMVFLHDWAIFLGVVFASLIASSLIGWLLCRLRVMPQTTGLWGTTPGAASAMVIMAGVYGADVRLVAVMQYLRVMCVAVAAALAAHFFAPPNPLHDSLWLAPFDSLSLLATIAIATGGALLAVLLRLPSGMLLLPMVVAAALNVLGYVQVEVPMWWRVIAFTLIGWVIGLRFTRRVFLYSLHALPKIMLSIAALMSVCALLGVLVAYLLHVDLLTAFLATSPGGADAMVIIAASTNIDLPFVMGMQIARLVIVVILGPPIAKWLAERVCDRSTKHHENHR